MSKTAAEVIAEIFAAGEFDPASAPFAAALREAWEAGEWSEDRIEGIVRAGAGAQ